MSACSAATKVDTVIIGAGVIGLAVARALAAAAPDKQIPEILLLDRAAAIGSETSSRNSEVIHAGLYYPTHSWKAQFCVRGKQQLYEYCESRSIPYRKCGKLILATQREHVDTLSKLHQQALSNGIRDTVILSTPQQVWEREPSLLSNNNNLHGALWSPSTGIVHSHTFMLHLLTDAEHNGVTTLALHSKVEDANIIQSNNRIHLKAAGMWLSCRNVVNCAGLWAGQVASLLHPSSTSTAWQPPTHYFARGTYFRLQQQQPSCSFTHLIYPVPDPSGGLGVHLTMDLQGQVKFGPDVEWLDASIHNPDDIDMNPDSSRTDSFYQSIRTYWPDLQDGALVPDYTGVRPKLQHPSLLPGKQSLPFQDFVTAGPETHGVPGLIHLFGIESPGLTSSMAIAEYICDKMSRW